MLPIFVKFITVSYTKLQRQQYQDICTKMSVRDWFNNVLATLGKSPGEIPGMVHASLVVVPLLCVCCFQYACPHALQCHCYMKCYCYHANMQGHNVVAACPVSQCCVIVISVPMYWRKYTCIVFRVVQHMAVISYKLPSCTACLL